METAIIESLRPFYPLTDLSFAEKRQKLSLKCSPPIKLTSPISCVDLVKHRQVPPELKQIFFYRQSYLAWPA